MKPWAGGDWKETVIVRGQAAALIIPDSLYCVLPSRPPLHGFHALSLTRDWQFWLIIYPQTHVVWIPSHSELAGVSSLYHCAPSTSLASESRAQVFVVSSPSWMTSISTLELR
jgi:hypothetical protein